MAGRRFLLEVVLRRSRRGVFVGTKRAISDTETRGRRP
jgi:hypothetical protein